MITLRARQIRAMEEGVEARFRRTVAEHLRRRHGEEVAHLSAEELDAQVEQALARARAYGVRSQRALCAFVVLSMVIHPGFDRHPAVRECLEAEAVPPDERVQLAAETLPEEVWEEVERGAFPEAREGYPRVVRPGLA